MNVNYWRCSFLFCFFQAAELIENKGIIFEGQTWMFEGCTFYFPGVRNSEYCPSMTRPICYVYNGAICCASECSGIACFCLSWLAHAWSNPNNPSLVYSLMRCTFTWWRAYYAEQANIEAVSTFATRYKQRSSYTIHTAVLLFSPQ